MADRTPEVMSDLARLMSNPDDLTAMSDEEIVEAIRSAREARKVAQTYGAAELQSRGWSVDRIGKALGVHRSQPHRWAQGRPDGDGAAEDVDE